MKKDVRLKYRPGSFSSSKFANYQLVRLLKLSQELETVYKTYPKLRSVVGYQAWQELTDNVYAQVLKLNLNPEDESLRSDISANFNRLEDIAAAALVRDRAGLRDILSRVLQFRLINGLATNRHAK